MPNLAIVITPPAPFAVNDETVRHELKPVRRASYAPPPQQRANVTSLQEERIWLKQRALKVMQAAELALERSEPLQPEPERQKMLAMLNPSNREKAILTRAERLLKAF